MMKRSKIKGLRLAAMVAAGLFVTGAWAAIVVGLGPGTPTPSVPVLDVTGQYAGKRTCYVCEFQDDPNVIAFFRDADPQTAELIVQLDKLYRQEKNRNFKAVAILVAGPDVKPWLEELRNSRSIAIPLVVFARGPKDVGVKLYKLNPEVRNNFLITRYRTVESNVSDIEPSEFAQVTQATLGMLAKSKS
jgi:hypothetical protein